MKKKLFFPIFALAVLFIASSAFVTESSTDAMTIKFKIKNDLSDVDIDITCVKPRKKMEKLGSINRGSSMQLELLKGTEVYAMTRFLFKVEPVVTVNSKPIPLIDGQQEIALSSLCGGKTMADCLKNLSSRPN